MLEVTSEALLFLLRALQERQTPENIAMRLTRSETGLEVTPDKERPGDRGFDFSERTVLVLDKALAEEMDGQRLCVIEDPSGGAELHVEPS